LACFSSSSFLVRCGYFLVPCAVRQKGGGGKNELRAHVQKGGGGRRALCGAAIFCLLLVLVCKGLTNV
jgi:hypothetical protein